ncbi:MAG: tetratricopeptide repeat protein [Sandaracinaceae bacterium]|nr:tetratricopeptide repeat protein [Sandaracinaceae bacterium]
MFTLLLSGALTGCGGDAAPASHGQEATASASAETLAAATPTATAAPTPEGPPEFAPYQATAPACVGSGGDARASRRALQQVARGRDAAPPVAATLLEGCATTPARVAAAIARGGHARLRQHPEEALAWYARALEVDPSSLDTRLDLAGALASVGRHDKALEQLDVVLSVDSGPVRVDALLTQRRRVALRALPGFWSRAAFARAPEAWVGLATLGADVSDERAPQRLPPIALALPAGLSAPPTSPRIREPARLPNAAYASLVRPVLDAQGLHHIALRAPTSAVQYGPPAAEDTEGLAWEGLRAPHWWTPVVGSTYLVLPLEVELRASQRTDNIYDELSDLHSGDHPELALLVFEWRNDELHLVHAVRWAGLGCPGDAFMGPIASRDHRFVGLAQGCDDIRSTRGTQCLLGAADGSLAWRCGSAVPADEAEAGVDVGDAVDDAADDEDAWQGDPDEEDAWQEQGEE